MGVAEAPRPRSQVEVLERLAPAAERRGFQARRSLNSLRFNEAQAASGWVEPQQFRARDLDLG